MTKYIVFFLILFLILIGTLSSAPEPFEVREPKNVQNPEEIKNKRTFQSELSSIDFFPNAGFILEIPWYPMRKFLNYSERTDFFNRTIDLFYFNEERTIGWFPNFSSSNSDISGTGLSLFHHDLYGKKHEADFSFILGDDDEFSVNGSLTIKDSENNPFYFTLTAGHLREEDVDIFTRSAAAERALLGSETREQDEKEYFSRRFDARLTVGKKIHKNFDLSLHVRGVNEKTKAGSSGLPADLEGLGESIDLFGGGVGVKNGWSR